MKKVILASASPRRRDLLLQIGLNFEVVPGDVDEQINESNPVQLVKKLALLKASDVAAKVEGVVIGADTIVVDGQTVLGKPGSEDEAVLMLKKLSGSEHRVMTGVAVIDTYSKRKWVDVEITKVYFRQLNDAEILRYVASKEPMDKAGAYAIQGRGGLFVEKIEGCFFNVVGLPVLKTARMLVQAGIKIF